MDQLGPLTETGRFVILSNWLQSLTVTAGLGVEQMEDSQCSDKLLDRRMPFKIILVSELSDKR